MTSTMRPQRFSLAAICLGVLVNGVTAPAQTQTQEPASAASARIEAERGDAAAQFNLGVMYAQGLGMPQDVAQAALWFRRAADQGHAAAQSNLGVLYALGRGVPQDDAEAAKWYRKAADQGY